MKNRYMLLVILSLCLNACDFMDCDESSDYDAENIFTSYDRTRQMVSNIYSYLPNGLGTLDGAQQESGVDDAVHVYEDSKVQYFVNGTWSPIKTVDDVWSKYYEAIRASNLYLKESEGQTFEDWKYSEKYEDWMKHFENFQYEVRFLRAFFYFELVKRYNNIPLITDVLTIDEANVVIPSTFEEVVNYIVEECNSIAYKLPITYGEGFTDKEYGRITRGAALALKSRALLYKASPLYSEDDKEKWKDAARAALEIISNSQELGYQLGKYENLFSETNNMVPENILVRPAGNSGGFEQANFPIGVQEGETSTCPTENLVSAYETITGEIFDWSNPVMKDNPYSNRDPRLALTIAYNGMQWPHSEKLEVWYGGKNGLPQNNASTTGYYLKKYVNNNISFDNGSTVKTAQHSWVIFRYGEILLNYAEAMVNAFDNPDYKDAEFTISAREAVNELRARPGINMPPIENTDKDRFIARLKNERRVELAFEGHRFWDVRRWKDLDKTKEIYGVSVIKNSDNTFTYTRQLIANHIVNNCMYFYPISNEEIYKNSNLIQNEGWN